LYEADDYLASLARLCRDSDIAMTVITRDKDLGQLLNGAGDRWWDFAADVQLDSLAFEERFGVTPQQFAQYQALVGDPIDDIPGVPGVGAKTAAALMQAFGDLDSLATRFDDVGSLAIRGAARVQSALMANWEQVEVARQLTRLAPRIPEVDTLPAYAPSSDRFSAFAEHLSALGLPASLLRRCDRLSREFSV
jgi:5'-3' exonuclease